MEKTVLLSLCSLCFLAFTLTGNAENENQKKNDKNALVQSVNVELRTDTIPAEGTYRIHKKTNEQEISIEVENGDIKQLSIDGKEIAPSQFEEYDDVINELFGEVEAPPSMEGFYYGMPALPPVPHAPGMEQLPPMPPMPPMTPMQQMEIERFYNDGNIVIGGGENLRHKIFTDSLGETRIIIIGEGGDTSLLLRPGAYSFSHGYAPAIELEEFRMNADEWKKHEKEWQKMSEEWKQNWQEHSQEWQQQWKAHEEEMKEFQKHLQGNEYLLRDEELKGHLKFKEKQLEEIEGLYGGQGLGKSRIYAMRAPGMRMTDALVEEGLIEPGEEAEIVLTPDKLKINGKKMDDETHKRYLKMYEAQQGVELSGNSRVEFRTKSPRSM